MFGFRIRDTEGDVVFDSTWRLGKILAEVSTGTSDGSAAVDLSSGEPFAIMTPRGGSLDTLFSPEIDYSSSGLTWTWGSIPTENRVDCLLRIGTF